MIGFKPIITESIVLATNTSPKAIIKTGVWLCRIENIAILQVNPTVNDEGSNDLAAFIHTVVHDGDSNADVASSD